MILGEDVVEAARRDPNVERHRAALEAVHRYAGAALLALLATAAGLDQARADATSDTDATLAGARIVTNFVQFHIFALAFAVFARPHASMRTRSEEHTSELQSLMRISYAVVCLKKKKRSDTETTEQQITKAHTITSIIRETK